jgi:hypothetical protein
MHPQLRLLLLFVTLYSLHLRARRRRIVAMAQVATQANVALVAAAGGGTAAITNLPPHLPPAKRRYWSLYATPGGTGEERRARWLDLIQEHWRRHETAPGELDDVVDRAYIETFRQGCTSLKQGCVMARQLPHTLGATGEPHRAAWCSAARCDAARRDAVRSAAQRRAQRPHAASGAPLRIPFTSVSMAVTILWVAQHPLPTPPPPPPCAFAGWTVAPSTFCWTAMGICGQSRGRACATL